MLIKYKFYVKNTCLLTKYSPYNQSMGVISTWLRVGWNLVYHPTLSFTKFLRWLGSAVKLVSIIWGVTIWGSVLNRLHRYKLHVGFYKKNSLNYFFKSILISLSWFIPKRAARSINPGNARNFLNFRIGWTYF